MKRGKAYYVYELVDPRDGAVFYVGKGCGARINGHEREAASGRRSRKCDRIREIQAADCQVGKRLVASFVREQDAYDFEAERIEEIGLCNLTNVMPGGVPHCWVGASKRGPNRTTLRVRRAITRLVVNLLPKADGWIARVAETNPAKAAEMRLRLSDFVT